jgi:hypothetical protein
VTKSQFQPLGWWFLGSISGSDPHQVGHGEHVPCGLIRVSVCTICTISDHWCLGSIPGWKRSLRRRSAASPATWRCGRRSPGQRWTEKRHWGTPAECRSWSPPPGRVRSPRRTGTSAGDPLRVEEHTRIRTSLFILIQTTQYKVLTAPIHVQNYFSRKSIVLII